MKTAAFDRLIIVDAKKLLHYTDQDDLNCRNSVVIKDLYHQDWFFEYNNEDYFIPPAVYITKGVIKFINGRHRSIMLSRHIENFPLLIGNIDNDICGGVASSKSIDVLVDISVKQLTEHSIICNLPELDFGDFESA